MFSCINRGIPCTPVPHVASISCPTLSPSPFRGHTPSSSKRRNYLKSDMHKVLLFHYRLRHICLIPSISPFFFRTRRSDLVLTICIRQAPRHANGFKMCIGFVVCVKLHFHSGCNSVLIFRSFVRSFVHTVGLLVSPRMAKGVAMLLQMRDDCWQWWCKMFSIWRKR